MDNETRKPIPKNAFDSEYMTEWLREMRFLTEKGIRYTFVRKTPEYGISQFKYKKTPALFAALVEFYAIVEAEKAVRRKKVTTTTNNNEVVYVPAVAPQERITPEELKKAQEILEKAVAQGVIKEGIPVAKLEEGSIDITITKDDTI